MRASRALPAIFLCAVPLMCPAAAPAQHTIRVVGRIVAHDNPLACLNGNAYWSMIVRVSNAKATGSEFIRIGFSLPCATSPKWPTAKAPLQHFRLIRDQDLDGVLDQFLACKTESGEPCHPMPKWTYVSDAERDGLPFGQQLPGFRSFELPLMPVL